MASGSKILGINLVALLAEGVDRNKDDLLYIKSIDVALLAEGVDRNSKAYTITSSSKQSPSSRRAWIEIQIKRLGTKKK